MILPSTGNVKTLTLLVEFADRPSRIPAATIASKIYGPGDTDFPYESPAAFYRRSSFGQLNFTGTTLGWFRLSQPLAYYAALDSNAAVQSMVTEALNYYSSPAGGSMDFATGVVSYLFRLPVRVKNTPTSLTAAGLPPGLRLEPLQAAIVGVPSAPGVFAVTVTASNALASVSFNVSIQILSQAPPAQLAPNGGAFTQLNTSGFGSAPSKLTWWLPTSLPVPPRSP